MRKWQVGVATQPATTRPATADNEPAPILLKGALAAAASQQQFSVHLESRSTLEADTAIERSESLLLQFEGNLAPAPEPAARDTALRLTLTQLRIRLETHQIDRPDTSLTFDSTHPGETNALSRTVTPLVGAPLRIMISSTGQLRDLHGVSAALRSRRPDVPPPLGAMNSLLNDTAFAGLIAQALFPSLPSSPLRPTDTWQLPVATFPLDPCPTLTVLKGKIEAEGLDTSGLPVLTLVSEGEIHPDTGAASVRLIHGQQHVWQRLSWNDHSLAQSVQREMEFSPRPGSPLASQPAHRIVHRVTLKSTRAGAAAQSRPG